MPGGQNIFTAAPPELLTRLQQASELELNDVFGQEIMAFVTERPGEFLALSARKFVYFWWLSPQAGVLYPSAWLAAYQLYAATILTLAAVGTLAILRGGGADERRLLSTLFTISLTLAVVHALSYVEGRHRWGIEPLLLLLSARGLFGIVRVFRSPYLRITSA